MLRPIGDMKTYQAMVNNAKQIEMICNSFGEANQLKNTIELVGGKEMVLIAECFVRQIYRESGEDFNGYYGVSVMMDDRNAASFDFAKQLMENAQFKSKIEQETEFFEPLGAEDLRFNNYIERIYNRLLIKSIYNRLLIKSKELRGARKSPLFERNSMKIEEINKQIQKENETIAKLYSQIWEYQEAITRLKSERESIIFALPDDETSFIDNWLNEKFGISSQKAARLKSIFKEDDSRIGNSEVEAAVVALYFTRTHKTLQQNLFRICCNLLREKGYIDSTTKIYLPYI